MDNVVTLPTEDLSRGAALLLEGNGRRQPVDGVDVGDGHLMEQAPRVGRHRFEVTPLRFGVEGAKGERGLARARHAREDDEGVAWYVDVHVLQVVLARPLHTHEPAG